MGFAERRARRGQEEAAVVARSEALKLICMIFFHNLVDRAAPREDVGNRHGRYVADRAAPLKGLGQCRGQLYDWEKVCIAVSALLASDREAQSLQDSRRRQLVRLLTASFVVSDVVEGWKPL